MEKITDHPMYGRIHPGYRKFYPKKKRNKAALLIKGLVRLLVLVAMLPLIPLIYYISED